MRSSAARKQLRRSHRSHGVPLLLAALLLPLSLGWVVYSFRAVDVACQRAAGPVTCRAVETVAGREVWSAEVEDVRLARAMPRSGGGPTGVIVETETGARAPLTSSVIGSDQQEAIANRIHQWLFVQRDEPTLAFRQPPSLANAALGGGIALLVALWGLSSLLGLRRARQRPARKT